jgi:hypothetical protein
VGGELVAQLLRSRFRPLESLLQLALYFLESLPSSFFLFSENRNPGCQEFLSLLEFVKQGLFVGFDQYAPHTLVDWRLIGRLFQF